jgi:hypothetical protein
MYKEYTMMFMLIRLLSNEIVNDYCLENIVDVVDRILLAIALSI